MPDGPGFPRQPPSTYATSSAITSLCCRSRTALRPRVLHFSRFFSASTMDSPSLHDAPIQELRQDDYLILFHHLAFTDNVVQFAVQKTDQFNTLVHNFPHCSDLRFRLCTAPGLATAPLVCVDFSSYSGNFAHVDGRKGWHNKMSQPEVD